MKARLTVDVNVDPGETNLGAPVAHAETTARSWANCETNWLERRSIRFGVTVAEGRSVLPKVVVLGTGGTIAGSAPSNTQLHDYEPKVAIQALIAGIPGLS